MDFLTPQNGKSSQQHRSYNNFYNKKINLNNSSILFYPLQDPSAHKYPMSSVNGITSYNNHLLRKRTKRRALNLTYWILTFWREWACSQTKNSKKNKWNRSKILLKFNNPKNRINLWKCQTTLWKNYNKEIQILSSLIMSQHWAKYNKKWKKGKISVS